MKEQFEEWQIATGRTLSLEKDSSGAYCQINTQHAFETFSEITEWARRHTVPTKDHEVPLPCPFCGGVAEVQTGGFGEQFVECTNANCGGRLGAGIWFARPEDAIRVWNLRHNAGGEH